jgi:hypothetical protein
MLTLFIVLGIIGYVINLTYGIKIIVDGWINKDKKIFQLGTSVTLIGIFFGMVTGWALLAWVIEDKYIDTHFKGGNK